MPRMSHHSQGTENEHPEQRAWEAPRLDRLGVTDSKKSSSPNESTGGTISHGPS